MNHPNVVKVLGYGIAPRRFIILEKLKVISDIINLNYETKYNNNNDNGTAVPLHRSIFDYKTIIQIAIQLADAIDYLHNHFSDQSMIIHRDIKPDNIGIDSAGVLKLFDFGLSICVKKRANSETVYVMTGNAGSLRYMVSLFSFLIIVECCD